jgi:hypothetical protein
MFPRQVRLGRTASSPAALGLTATEGGHWVLAGGGGAGPAVTVSGPAEAVFLLLWHRIVLDDPRLTVSGSRAAADAVLAAALDAVTQGDEAGAPGTVGARAYAASCGRADPGQRHRGGP